MLPRRGLIVKNDGIGDLVLASGVIGALSASYPDGVDLVVRQGTEELARMVPGVRGVYAVSLDDLRLSKLATRIGLRVPLGSADDFRVLAQLAMKRYRQAIVLRRFIRHSTFALMQVCRAAERYVMWQYPTNIPYALAQQFSRGWTHLTADQAKRSEQTYYEAIASQVLGHTVSAPPRLNGFAGPTRSVGSNRIAVIIGGDSSRWPGWKALCAALIAKGYALALLGGPNSARLAQEIAEQHPRAANLTARLSLAETADLLQGCRAVIGNDTGLTHFSSLVIDPVLVVLGGGTFGRFFPWPETKNQYMIYAAMDCFDCTWQCKHESLRCFDALTVGHIVQYLEHILTATEPQQMRNLTPEAVRSRVAWQIARPSEPGFFSIPATTGAD